MTYGEAANKTISGLAAQPALLLIAVLNVAMLFGVGYVARSQVDERRELVKLLVDCGKTSEAK